MPSLNKLQIIGHVGNYQGLRYTANGKAILNFSVAVNSGRKQDDGSFSDETTWFRIVTFGQVAERLAPQIDKGSLVMVEGPVKLDSYKGNDGVERYSLEVVGFSALALSKLNSAPAQKHLDSDDLPFE